MAVDMALECRGRLRVTTRYPPWVPATGLRSTRTGGSSGSWSWEWEGEEAAEEEKEREGEARGRRGRRRVVGRRARLMVVVAAARKVRGMALSNMVLG